MCQPAHNLWPGHTMQAHHLGEAMLRMLRPPHCCNPKSVGGHHARGRMHFRLGMRFLRNLQKLTRESFEVHLGCRRNGVSIKSVVILCCIGTYKHPLHTLGCVGGWLWEAARLPHRQVQQALIIFGTFIVGIHLAVRHLVCLDLWVAYACVLSCACMIMEHE